MGAVVGLGVEVTVTVGEGLSTGLTEGLVGTSVGVGVGEGERLAVGDKVIEGFSSLSHQFLGVLVGVGLKVGVGESWHAPRVSSPLLVWPRWPFMSPSLSVQMVCGL